MIKRSNGLYHVSFCQVTPKVWQKSEVTIGSSPLIMIIIMIMMVILIVITNVKGHDILVLLKLR